MARGQYREPGEVIGVFNNHRGALQLKEAIQAAGVSAQKVEIDDRVSPLNQIYALGTTTGGQAGLLIGAAYGGILGILFVFLVLVPLSGATDYSNISPLSIYLFTLVGAVVGWASGKGLRANAPREEQIKGNPNVPRNFRVVVNGSEDEVQRAHQAMLQQSVAQS
ncbi:MAG: hypothetical protein ICV62_06705 [Cyanobacteria bacterium Co-bin13]|nr:hypothetical protein [Cyanobacteria bacterium Co-bin13]